MKKSIIVLMLSAVPAGSVYAEGVAGGLAAGTLGLGAQLAFGLRDDINLRIGANWLDFNYDYHYHDVDYDSRVKLLNVPLTVDWFPTKGIFRLSAGGRTRESSSSATTPMARPRSGRSMPR